MLRRQLSDRIAAPCEDLPGCIRLSDEAPSAMAQPAAASRYEQVQFGTRDGWSLRTNDTHACTSMRRDVVNSNAFLFAGSAIGRGRLDKQESNRLTSG